MRATTGPRWVAVLVASVLAGCGILLLATLIGSGPAVLRPLSARLPLAAAGTLAAPLLSALLGIGGGLLAARRTEWVNRRLRALIIAGCCACLGWVGLVTAFWFVVQGELQALQTLGPADRAGASALSTLLIPATAVVFGAAWLIAGYVRAETRSVALAGHVRTAHSWGLSTAGRVIRRVLRATLPTVLVVLVIELLILYAGSLAVQAVFSTPALASTLPMLPPESLPVVLMVTLLGIVALSFTGIPVLRMAVGPPASPLQPSAPPTRPEPADQILPSTTFRSSDILDIRDLRLHPGPGPELREPLTGISLTVARGQSIAVVGDHGDGASLLCHAIAGLPPLHSAVSSGSILFDGTELVGLPERQFHNLRGRRIGFLDAPGTSCLDPHTRIGRQLTALMRGRQRRSRSFARADVLTALHAVGIQDAAAVFAAYPHQVSDATAQRVLLAAALARTPELLIADHPTERLPRGEETGFLDALHALQADRGFTLIVASSRVANVVRCDRVAVMNRGVIVEFASSQDLITAPRHPHSRQLIDTEQSARDGAAG
jgi:ABC-type dipeptide/oligopeptide/nickel transport system ATPase component/ABC-type dipeptide/oligopeptide/nickel transport system permease component